MSDSGSDDTLGASQSKLGEYKDMWAAAKEGNIVAGYVAVSHDNFESFRLYVNNHFYRLIILVRAASQAAKITRALFAKANLGASSPPTIARDAPCSNASCPRRSVNGPTLVLPLNSPLQVSSSTLSLFRPLLTLFLSVVVDENPTLSMGIDARAAQSLAHHRQYFYHTTDSLI